MTRAIAYLRVSTQEQTDSGAGLAAGVHCGRTSAVPEGIRARIRIWHQGGMTLSRIADNLNIAHVPTGQGGTKWRHQSVKAVLESMK
jgi:hypothetical protein